jgi:hypothetical protein
MPPIRDSKAAPMGDPVVGVAQRSGKGRVAHDADKGVGRAYVVKDDEEEEIPITYTSTQRSTFQCNAMR